MRKIPIAFAVVTVLCLGMAACEKQTAPDKAPGAPTPAGTAVKDAARDAGQAVNDAAKATGKAVDTAAKATGQAVEDAAKETGKAITATGEYLAGSKDSAVKAAQDSLDKLEKKWQDLQAKAAPATDEAKADFQKARDQMSQILADARVKLVEAKAAGDDAWQQKVKPALDAVVAKAQKLYDDAAAKFGGK